MGASVGSDCIAAGTHVDYVVRSRRVFTSVPGERGSHELAFAVSGDRIVLVGAPKDVLAAVPAAVPVHNLGDRFVCPGFHDAHLHFFHTAVGSSPFMLMHMGESEAELVARTREFAAGLPAHAWVVTQGWRDYRWDPPVPPTKESLDRAFPDRPCVMYSGDGHTLWMNSRALAELGVTRDSVPPSGGSYDKTSEGELTGIVREAAAMELLPRCLAWLRPQDIERAYVDQMARMTELGITSVCDMALMPHPGCDFIRDDIYEALEARGQLTMRAHLYPTLLEDQSRLERLQRRFAQSPLLRAPGFKQFFDGVSSQHTAYLRAPYTNARFEGDRGQTTVPFAAMRDMVMKAARMGYPVRIHTIGDEAIHEALDIFEEARETYGAPRFGRNALEHLENFQPDDIARLAELDVVASVQPPHITLDPGGPERDLGAERCRYMWPFATLLESGATLALGTDSPVVDIDARKVLYTAVTRQDATTHAPRGGWLPSERIGMAEALRAYTAGAAQAAADASIGTLEAGKWADIAVFDTDLLSEETAQHPERILSMRTLATYLAGTPVYTAE